MKRPLKFLTSLLVAAIVAVPMSAAAFLKIGDIKGEATDARHKDWIIIESWSMGASSPASSCSIGRLQFRVKGAPPAAMTQLCQSRRPVPSLVVDLDGTQHVLQNATFDGCQTDARPTEQFSMNYTKCATHAAPARTAANAVLIGLTGAPTPVLLENLTLADGTATMTLTKVGAGTLILPKIELPKMTIKVNNGPEWTFYKVTMSDLIVSSYSAGARSGGDRPMESLSLNFTKVEGPKAGYQFKR